MQGLQGESGYQPRCNKFVDIVRIKVLDCDVVSLEKKKIVPNHFHTYLSPWMWTVAVPCQTAREPVCNCEPEQVSINVAASRKGPVTDGQPLKLFYGM